MASGNEPRPFAPVVSYTCTKLDTENYIHYVYANSVKKSNDIKVIQLTFELNCPAFDSFYNLFSVPSDCIPSVNTSTMVITRTGSIFQITIDTSGIVKMVYNPILTNNTLVLISITYI